MFSFMSLVYNLSIHMLILLVFLTLFFYFYLSSYSSELLNEEIIKNASEHIKIVSNKLPDNIKNNVKSIINNINIPFLETIMIDKNIKDHNSQLFRFIFTINIAAFIIILLPIMVMYTSCNKTINLKEILVENIITFILVGFFEFVFFKFVASKYIPVLPSVVSNSFKNNFIELLKK